MLLGGGSEERRLGVQFVQVAQNGDRLGQHEITVLEHRNATSRIECQKVRGLVLPFGPLQVPDFEVYALRNKPQHHPPWARCAAYRIHFIGHLSPSASVSFTRRRLPVHWLLGRLPLQTSDSAA